MLNNNVKETTNRKDLEEMISSKLRDDATTIAYSFELFRKNFTPNEPAIKSMRTVIDAPEGLMLEVNYFKRQCNEQKITLDNREIHQWSDRELYQFALKTAKHKLKLFMQSGNDAMVVYFRFKSRDAVNTLFLNKVNK